MSTDDYSPNRARAAAGLPQHEDQGMLPGNPAPDGYWAIAHELRTLSMIRYWSGSSDDMAEERAMEIEERMGYSTPTVPAKVEHFRIAPGKCNCGFDAYQITGIMVDYSAHFQAHMRANR